MIMDDDDAFQTYFICDDPIDRRVSNDMIFTRAHLSLEHKKDLEHR
jgi:hypothetical protein